MNNLVAQELKIKYKVEEGKISLKWLPSNYFALRKMSEGATVQRIEVSDVSNLEALNYTNGVSWEIESLTERMVREGSGLDLLPDSTGNQLKVIIEPVLNWESDELARDFAFGSNVIWNVTDTIGQEVYGNYIEDINFDKSKSYAYKVVVNEVPPAYIFVNARKQTQYPTIDASLLLDDRRKVIVSWDYLNIKNDAFAFDIIHAVSDTMRTASLLEKPYLPFTTEQYLSDSTSFLHEAPEKGKIHFYKIIGRDAFAKGELFSKWYSIYVPDKIEAYPMIDSVSAAGKVRLVKSNVVNGAADTNIKYVALLRSSFKDKGYEIKTIETYNGDSLIEFRDSVDRQTGDAYYYKTALINNDDTVRSQPYYFFTLDQQPPKSPVDLTVDIDSAGLATLTWNAPEDKDIEGYRVFRANELEEEFIEQTQQLKRNTSFLDTLSLNNLTSEVYYYVTAVDKNFNQGATSDTIMSLKPDTIAPTSSLIQSISMVNRGVRLQLIKSTSEDVRRTLLFRNDIEIGSVDSIYLDTSVSAGQNYRYHLVTIDKSGNSSKSKTIEQRYEPGFREAATFNAEVIISESHVNLSWTIPADDVYDIKIYKGKSNEKIRLWKTLSNPSQSSIIDKWISIGDSYNYVIIYTTKDGIQSLKSETSIRY